MSAACAAPAEMRAGPAPPIIWWQERLEQGLSNFHQQIIAFEKVYWAEIMLWEVQIPQSLRPAWCLTSYIYGLPVFGVICDQSKNENHRTNGDWSNIILLAD
jgi:hypothetical protein